MIAVTEPGALAAYREFRRLAVAPLWPGFEPAAIPVEVFDGERTYLFQHPKPPEGFRALAGEPGAYVFAGRHETARANTGVEVNGAPTATADISGGRRSLAALGSLLIHEAFHVYQRRAHPKWTANEADLFTYPFDDAASLRDRRLETLALVRALQTASRSLSRDWARAGLAARRGRFARMPAAAVAYERGTELNEGLAQYVEYRSIRKPPALTLEDFALEGIRQRGYATGQAWALLLDRLAPGWMSEIDSTSLDEVLFARIGDKIGFSAKDSADQMAIAAREVQELIAAREKRKTDLLAAAGWRVEILAGQEPLWPQGFDPLNVSQVGRGEILHTRWLKLGNGNGAVEVLGHESLTEPVGAHPLFEGVRRLIVTGLPEPRVTEAYGKITLGVEGVTGTFTGTLERAANRIVLHVN